MRLLMGDLRRRVARLERAAQVKGGAPLITDAVFAEHVADDAYQLDDGRTVTGAELDRILAGLPGPGVRMVTFELTDEQPGAADG